MKMLLYLKVRNYISYWNKNKTFNEYKNESKNRLKNRSLFKSNYFGFQVSGFDKYFESTLKLLNEFMVEMHVREEDNNKLENLWKIVN